MSSSRGKGHNSRGLKSPRHPSSRMRRNNSTKEVSGWASHVVSSASQGNGGLTCQTLWGQSVLGQVFPTQVILEAPCHTKVTGREQAEGNARGRTLMSWKFKLPVQEGDTNSINKLSNEAMVSLKARAPRSTVCHV